MLSTTLRVSLFASLAVTTLSAESLVTAPKPTRFFDPQDGETVVFFGDSITHQCLYTQYLENFFYTRYPDRKIHFHNAGVSGDKAADGLVRFEEDVAAHDPDIVTILLGMNDGQYEPFSVETLTTYETGMDEVVTKLDDLDAAVIALSPTMFDHHQFALRREDPDFRFGDRDFFEEYNSLMAYYGASLRESARAREIPFVNLWGPLNDLTSAARLSQPDFTLVEDAIHPGAAGQFVIAFTILAASNQERRRVSDIEIFEEEGSWAPSRHETITDLVVSDAGDELTFTHHARSIPWVVPAESSQYELRWGASAPAALGYAMTKAGHRLGSERLRIEALVPGDYALSIDGEAIATFSADRLANGVELQKYLESPQNEQALAVALLNQQRNDEAVRPMRDLWGRIKGLRRKGDPEKLAEELPNLRKQIAKRQASAERFEAQIREAAQPVPREYRLNRVP